MIKTNDLQNREGGGDDADLKDGRPVASSPRPPGDPKTPRSHETEARQALTERIARAKKLTPQGAERHCADCWQKGRDAAIRMIEGEAEK